MVYGETLLDARRRLEESLRLQRIARAAPPVATFDGRLQAWRDAKGECEELVTIWSGGEGLTSFGRQR